MGKRVTVILTREQVDALRWIGNIGLRHATDDGPRPPTIAAAQRALETLTDALGLFPYRRGIEIYGRLTPHESSRVKH